MSEAFTTFNLHLTARMKDAENRFASFTSKVGDDAEHASDALRHQIAALEEGAARAKTSADASTAYIAKWMAGSTSSVEEWKTKVAINMLTARAERAGAYAKAASDVALTGIDAPEKAALGAKLAHVGRIVAKSPKSA